MANINVSFQRIIIEAAAQNQWVIIDYPFTVTPEYLGQSGGYRLIPKSIETLTGKHLAVLQAKTLASLDARNTQALFPNKAQEILLPPHSNQIASNRPNLTAKPLFKVISGNASITLESRTKGKLEAKKLLSLKTRKRE